MIQRSSCEINGWRRAFAALAVAATCAVTGTTRAQVQEPNGLLVPQPVTANEIGLVTGQQFPASAVTIAGLFAFRGETLDPVTDARTAPAVFSPLCGFQATLVLRGGGCKVDFGWYNATQSGGAPPPDAEIYPLIEQTDPEVYDCSYQGAFCPLAFNGMAPPPGQKPWTLKTIDSGNIRADPMGRYQGGLVGFALKGNPASCCTQTKFSQPELNQRCTTCTPANAPWVNALIYRSTATPDSFYMAFEDLPTSPTAFNAMTMNNGTCNGTFQNDGDFNDFVFFVSGITCAGGGQPCDASATDPNLKGACTLGQTDCSTDGMGTTCRSVVRPSAESCDNVDNDCNGVVDDGDGLCPAGQVCDRGVCVAGCNTGEFRCSVGYVCENDFCVDPACSAVTCPAGQACRGGQCVGACDGVTCPLNQECQLGRCVDLCAGVTCPESKVCERGVCISSCQCSPCADGKTCAADGHCVDTGCETTTCAPGSVCVQGACVDACQNAVCPGGADCAEGACGEPKPGVVGPGAGGVGAGGGPIIGSGGGSVGAGATNPGSAGTGGDGGPPGDRATADSGCACRAARSESSSPLLALAGLLGLGLLARRRAAARRAS